MIRILTFVLLMLLQPACQKTSPAPTEPSPASATTFNLAGAVQDTLQRPVPNATVEALDGPLAGEFTTTDQEGRFALPSFTAPTPAVRLQVTREGYTPAILRIANQARILVILKPLALIDPRGEYEITLTAGDSCDGIPPPLHTRSYTATISRITSDGVDVKITLGGAEFPPYYNAFSARLAGDAARFFVFSIDANGLQDDLPIIERPDPTTYLSFGGITNATTVKADAPITAVFDGSIAYCSAAQDPIAAGYPPHCSVPLTECKSKTHQMSLLRR
jgi:hypothetical protein